IFQHTGSASHRSLRLMRTTAPSASGRPAVVSAVTIAAPAAIATATLTMETRGAGFVEFTREAERFLADAAAGDGLLFLFLRHTSASLVIQENADPDVQRDLVTALDRLAPADAG